MIAVGIDPGTAKTGYGVVRRDGARLIRLASGTIRTNTQADMPARLLTLHEGLEQLLTAYGPDQAAVEDIFFSNNAKSAIKLAQARGAILVTLAKREIPIASYAPAFVKRAVVGGGRAVKSQVQRVVQAILRMEKMPGEDEGDALAVAICHLNALRMPGR